MNFDDDDIGALRSRRGARAQPPETDPRFIRAGRVGRVVPQLTNWGGTAFLLGSAPQGSAKLLRVEDDAKMPWQVSVASTYQTNVGNPQAGVRVVGLFGTGGGTCRVEFDAKPDQTIQLPGGAVDLDIGWEPLYRGDAANISGLLDGAIDSSLLPVRADVSAVACHGETARGRASRTQLFTGINAGNWFINTPAFADELAVVCPLDADYANITNVQLMTNGVFVASATVASYSGATLLAMKNAGQTIPIPGGVTAVRIVTAATISMRLAYYLSL